MTTVVNIGLINNNLTYARPVWYYYQSFL